MTGSSGSLRRLHTGAWSTVRGCPARLTAIVPIGAAAIAVGSDEAGNARAATLAADDCGPSVAAPDIIGKPWGVLVDTAWFVTASGISGIR